jgi:hypothetical protein
MSTVSLKQIEAALRSPRADQHLRMIERTRKTMQPMLDIVARNPAAFDEVSSKIELGAPR